MRSGYEISLFQHSSFLLVPCSPLSLGKTCGGGSVFAMNSHSLIGLPLSVEISSNNCSAEFWLCFAEVKSLFKISFTNLGQLGKE